MNVHGWGKYPVIDAEVSAPSMLAHLRDLLTPGTDKRLTPRGFGRSYGDSSLGKTMVSTIRLNHMLDFDQKSGVLHCQSGVPLADILKVFVPRGWFLPVTPGTKYVTVGGAIASDVHGKNHHVDGCFCDHVLFLELLTGNGEVVRCSLQEQSGLFHATCGGMGLTGMVLTAAIQLKSIKSACIDQVTYKAAGLDESLEQFEQHADEPYSVAWIDCISGGRALGRSLLMTGRHASEGESWAHRDSRITMPFDMPAILLNPFSIKVFNMFYYHKVRHRETRVSVHYEPFFYPLDRIGNWNRMYGKSGFIQYQFVVPKEAGKKAMKSILKVIAGSRKGSFLAVLKAFGPCNNNLLSFPVEGYTLALDFAFNADVFPLLDRLDAMVLDYGGKLYLTKDARMSGTTFRQSYPQWEAFQKIRDACGSLHRFTSLQSHRLGLDE